MNINRHNYEEYFLLYMDNELSAEERKMVEDFVQVNQDLATELEAILALRLDPAERLEFSAKNELLKPVQEENKAGEKELEQLLLFIDGELDAAEMPSFKNDLTNNKDLQKELELLKLTKLTPDLSVVFPDKTVLYRTERQPARVLFMRFASISVAAAVILIAGLLWINKPQDIQDQAGAAIAQAEEQQAVKTGETITKEGLISSETTGKPADSNHSPEESNQSIAQVSAKEKEQAQSAGKFARVTPDRSPEKDQRTAQDAIAADQSSTVPVIASLDNSSQRQSVNLTTPAIHQPPANIQPDLSVSGNIIDKPSVTGIKSDYATEALLSAHESVEVVQAESDDDRRGPVRGLFRKANRLFNKVTNPEKDGPTVKVASFEFALAK